MSLSSPKNTLAYQLTRPLLLKRDVSSVHMAQVVTQFNQVKEQNVPEHEALWFYLLNHAMHVVRQKVGLDEPLGPLAEIVEMYHAMLGPRAVRLFVYLVNICSRENRHEHGNSSLPGLLTEKCGADMAAYYKQFKSMGGSGGIPGHIVKHPANATIGQYTKALTLGFYKGSFSSGYGGKKWGVVADCLEHFVWGNYSAEMMMDVGWTLCHNNGPIFNKGMQYSGYNLAALHMILDVQRSGQIPQLITSGKLPCPVPPELMNSFKLICDLLPGFAEPGWVDWVKVKNDGAVHSWTTQINEQVTSGKGHHGDEKPAWAKKTMHHVGGVVKQQPFVTKPTQDLYTILPGLQVEKIKPPRKEVAA